jgi:hypothetical protein
MITVLSAAGFSALISGVALYHGRTVWRWCVLALAVYSALWLSSLAALYLAGVYLEHELADRRLALFVGAMTFAITFITLISAPDRPHKSVPSRHPDRAASGPSRIDP